MIRLRCPHCDRKLKAPDEAAATQQACPKCRKMMTVPGLVAPKDMMKPRSSRSLDAAFLIEKYVVHNGYEEQHRDIFDCVKNQSKAIAELMIFHGWTTQFGVRISSSYPEKSDALVSELVYLANQMCPFTLAIYHGVRFAGLPAVFVKDVKFAYSFPIEFGSALDARWQEYDSIYLRCRWEDEIFAQSAICEGVIKNCEIDTTQPSALMLRLVLSVWYLNRLFEIQGDAIQGGLLVKAK